MSEYVAIDLETTGYDSNHDSIIEVGAVRFGDNGELERYSTFVDPGRSVPYPVQRLTGITDKDLKGAPPFPEIASDLLSFVGAAPVIGHSVSFDLGFLARQGITFKGPCYDTHELSKILIPKASPRSLGALAERLGIDFPIRHRALGDALATMELFLALKKIALRLPEGLIQLLGRLDAGNTWQIGGFFQRLAQEAAVSAAQSPADKSAWLGLVSLLDRTESYEPLLPREEAEPLDLEAVAGFLGPQGPFAGLMPTFDHREEQVWMAKEVGKSLNIGRHLIVEAGTGTGKSLAYLLPAALKALKSNSTVVISTNTINLQEQLINKDIPTLASALQLGGYADGNQQAGQKSPLGLRASQLKGRSNYLCLRRLGAALTYPLSPPEASLIARALVWLTTTETGDRSELTLNSFEAPFWDRISAQEGDCNSNTCPFYRSGHCFMLRARKRAEASHLLVVNHALLVSDLLRDNRIIPEYESLIVDEAHHLEEVATEQLGIQVTQGQVMEHLNRLGQDTAGRSTGLLVRAMGLLGFGTLAPAVQERMTQRLQDLRRQAEALKKANEEFFSTVQRLLYQYASDGGMYGRRLRIAEPVRRTKEWRAAQKAWESLHQGLEELEEGLDRMASALEELRIGSDEHREELLAEVHSLLSRGGQIRAQVSSLISDRTEGQVHWLESQGQGNNLVLRSAPLDVSSELERLLFSQKSSVILASATLQVAGDFQYIKERLGAREAAELALDSPFNYKDSALIYVASDMPEPEKWNYNEALQRALIEVCSATQGRALVLFTSYSALQSTMSAISNPLAKEGIRVLAQGTDGTPDQVLAAFKEGPKCVLLGTSSLWEGVDVVGDALSLLIITRLPFPVPTDPVHAARGELYSNPFSQYSLPQAILRFRQGFGRLIRSREDRGAVLVLDPRVLTKGYGEHFLNSLPTCTTTKGPLREAPSAIASWLASKRS